MDITTIETMRSPDLIKITDRDSPKRNVDIKDIEINQKINQGIGLDSSDDYETEVTSN